MSINRSLHRIAKEGVAQTLEANDKEIERLNNIIKKAREYIEENMSYNTGVEIQYITSGEDLLDILNKGE